MVLGGADGNQDLLFFDRSFSFKDNNGIRLYSKSYNENARSAPITQQTHGSKVFPV